ncbi:hypothetical protein [Halocalculus aciditolerans]|uniref:Uncharacterized protein n=1 Tax=Halocalculus aciditolerans TaxID=1383812 RepID=A0A830F4M3_9EURY|nr:hypothetical protein [Halocalculus aciditolerans]GGL62298.1 hypothetical protein GCM10009039_20490 [Halocalculus aciditolerans]
MVSRENLVIGVCVVAALVLGLSVASATSLPSWVALAVFLGVGVLLPNLLNEFLRTRT